MNHNDANPKTPSTQKEGDSDQQRQLQHPENAPSAEDELKTLFKPITYRKLWSRLAFALVFVTFFGWLFLGSIPVIIYGRGIVISRQGLFSLQAKKSGIVKEIFVRPGEYVKSGQTLMHLSDPEQEKNLISTQMKVRKLQDDVDNLKNQIQVELAAQKNSILLQIEEAQDSIKELEKSIVNLKKEKETKEDLFKQKLIGLDSLFATDQLLSQSEVAVETTKGRLAALQANLTKSYRGQELLDRERDLLQAQQQFELIELNLNYLDVISTSAGVVIQVLVSLGDYVIEGAPLVRLENDTLSKQAYIFYAYVPAEFSKLIQVNTPVSVELSTVRAEEYGIVFGHIVQVSRYPVSRENIGNIIQNEGLVNYLVGDNKSVVQLVIEPEIDPTTYSGFKWSTGKGPSIKVSTGTVVTVKGLVAHLSPLYYLFNLWKVENLPFSNEPQPLNTTEQKK